MLVQSIRLFNPAAEIIYCTDAESPDIEGITRRVQSKGNRGHLMTFRIRAFTEAQLDYPALYIDTDMLCTKPIDPKALLQYRDILMCKRSFMRNAPFNGNFRGMNFMEYDQTPLGEVYPFLACATVTKNSSIWKNLLIIMKSLDIKFHVWYGDQEALKILASEMTDDKLGYIDESVYACLPEENYFLPSASMLHFKGASRKPAMALLYEKFTKNQRA